MTEDKKDPEVSVVTEANWEEDTVEVAAPKAATEVESPSKDATGAPMQDAVTLVPGRDEDPEVVMNVVEEDLVAPPPPELELPPAPDEQEELPLDEELSDSLRPVPPPIPSIRPSQRPEMQVAIPHRRATISSAPESDQRISDPPPTRASSPFALHLENSRKLGTGLWYAGVFLWAFIIVGEYVVSAQLPEFFGWSMFSGIVVGAFLQGANRIGTQAMIRVAALSVASVIGGTLFLSTILGSSSRSEYQLVTFLLLGLSVGLIAWGLRRARGDLVPTVRAGAPKWRRFVTWCLFAGNTALIAFALLAQM